MNGPGQALLRALEAEGLAGNDLELAADEPMARHTTLRLGGPADLWARPSSVAALSRLLAWASARALPCTFVGGGTNLLVRDGGIPGVVINLGRLAAVERPDPVGTRVDAQAGCSTGRLLARTIAWELGGVEFLGGVPGSVGGGLIMNAGTYLGEFTDVVTHVHSVGLDGTRKTRDHDACGFRYRASDLPADEIVVGCTLSLHPRARADIEGDVRALREQRREREPQGVPNNGSTFKNPPGDHAGRIIEAVGLKGTRRGGAVVSPKHANWLVVDKDHAPRCTAADLLALIEHVRETVAERTGLHLELEVKVVGVDRRDLL
jgi:UDP-N-acetylmuramate dehydrogenase